MRAAGLDFNDGIARAGFRFEDVSQFPLKLLRHGCGRQFRTFTGRWNGMVGVCHRRFFGYG